MRELYEALPCGIVWCAISGDPEIRYCNGKAIQTFGYGSRDEMIAEGGTKLLSYIHPDDRDRFMQTGEAYARGNTGSLKVECRIVGAGGKLSWISATAKKASAYTGKQLMQMLFTDITEQKQKEIELEEANEKTQNIINAIPGGVAIYKASNIFETVYFSDGVPALSGYSVEEYQELIKQDALNLTYSGDREMLAREVTRVIANDAPINIEFRKTHKNGQIVWVHMYGQKIGEEDGCPLFQCVFHNITDQKKTQQELDHIINSMPGGLVVMRHSPDEGLTPELFSEGFCEMIGIDGDCQIASYPYDMEAGIHPDDYQPVMEQTKKYIHDKKNSWEFVYRMLNHNGQYIWVKNKSSLSVEGDDLRIYCLFSDVTEDVMKQTALQKKYNNMLLQHHLTLAPNEIIAGHCNISRGRIVEITDKTDSRLLDTFGYDRDTFFKGVSSFIIDEKERQNFLDVMLSAPLLKVFDEDNTKVECECFLRLPDESKNRYVHMEIKLVMSPDTDDVMGILSVMDMTEQRISGQILKRLAEVNYDFITEVDLDQDSYELVSIAPWLSHTLPRRGCYTEMVEKSFTSMAQPKYRSICTSMLAPAYMKKRLAEEGTYSLHYALEDESGDIYTKNLLIFQIDEHIDRICLARVDVTDTVREQQGLLRMLACTFEMAGFINISDGRTTIYTRESILHNLSPTFGENFFDACGESDAQYCLANNSEEMRRQFSTEEMKKRLKEKPEGYELIFEYDGSGETRYKQFNILWSDENHRAICVVRADITDVIIEEQKSKETLQNALEIAQGANRAKSDFLSEMSHDIRTPMNAIMGMTDLALNDRDNAEQIDESLQVIKSSSELLLKLINEILDMSRLESGRMVLAKEPFNHRKEAKKAIARAEALAEKKKIHFKWNMNIRHDECIGDALRIHQVFDNLIGNAVKFTPEGGNVTLDITELPQRNSNIGWYRFTVTDTGMGISEENIEHLFDPFFRIANSADSSIEGTGLGLPIVKSILDYKGGTIEVKSKLGQGSEFIADIPIQLANADDVSVHAEDSQKTLPEVDFSGMRILLIEDNEINRIVARKTLSITGAEIVMAADGKEGFEVFANSREGEFDAILMDVQMPVMTGYEATREIRRCSHSQAKTIPIIAMTANVFASDIQNCLDSGMNAHIAKPIEPQKVYALLQEYMRKRN